jgi:transposase
MSHATGLSRGDRNRNERLTRLRELVPPSNAIVAIDLADDKQMTVVADHDSRVLARRTFRCKAWQLGTALDWAATQATQAGFAGGTVSVEPTGHRWRVVGQLAADRCMPFVCVQPLLVHRSREDEDFTLDKTDDKDAVLIARLTAKLHCYAPEPMDETWVRLRHLGQRRTRLLVETSGLMFQVRDLLECAWPAVLEAAAQPFKSMTWCAALTVVLDRCNGEPARLRRLGEERFAAAVGREIQRWGGARPCRRIVRTVFAALADRTGVLAQRPGALERAGFALDDWREHRRRMTETERRMVEVVDELALLELVTSIDGLSALSAATVLAETGDLNRFVCGRSVVKHSGLAPRENSSGRSIGRTRTSGRGRPGLRTSAWRAAWGLIHSNPIYAARYRYLTTRATNKLHPTEAYCALAAALLRQLHAVVTRQQAWNPVIAAGGMMLEQAA